MFLELCENRMFGHAFWRFRDARLGQNPPFVGGLFKGDVAGHHNRILLGSLYIRRHEQKTEDG